MALDPCEACPLHQAARAVASAVLERLQCPAPHGTGRWLTPREAAARMGVSVRWLQRRRRHLDFIEPLPGSSRGWRVNEARFVRYLDKQPRA